jgi:hypothetical protein
MVAGLNANIAVKTVHLMKRKWKMKPRVVLPKEKRRSIPPCEACARLKAGGLNRKCMECEDMNKFLASGKIVKLDSWELEAEVKTEAAKCTHCGTPEEDHANEGRRCPITNKHPRSWGLTTFEAKVYKCRKCNNPMTDRRFICKECDGQLESDDGVLIYNQY